MIVLLVAALAWWRASLSDQVTQVQETQAEYDATVIRVVDGDTVVADVQGLPVRVRLIGIDAPESVHPGEEVACAGPEATDQARELLRPGDAIGLSTDPSQDRHDRYQRLLAFLTMPDGRDFGAAMIEAGYAVEFTFARPHARQQEYRELERQAARAGVGMWGSCP